MDKLLCYKDTKNQQIKPKHNGDLRIMSYNIHGFKNKSNKLQIQEIINAATKIDPDILVLQEVYIYKKNETITSDQLIDLFSKIGFKYFAFSKSGVNAICSKIQFECKSIDLIKDPINGLPRNALFCDFPQFNDFTLVGTHLDPFDESGKTRLEQIKHIYSVNTNKHFVIAGDFNSLRRADYDDDEWNEILLVGKQRKIEPIEDVIPWLESHGFVDSFNQTGKKISVSVWSNRRVDYIVGSNVNFTHSDVLETTASDHYPIFADIRF